MPSDALPKDKLQPGQTVGHLKIERLIGRGGFGQVFRARDSLIDRPVALKVLEMRGSDHDEARAMFLREARLIGKLRSPHVVTLHQVHPLDDGGLVLEMEHVGGGSLADRLAGGARLSAPAVSNIARQLLSALDDAHSLDIVHRDIKPANVLLTEDGTAKLADFGLAYLSLQASAKSAEGLVGTPAYVAPEVLMGEPATPASDLWSLGVLLFRALSGRSPFEVEDQQQLFFAIMNSPPPALAPAPPRELARLVNRCLAKRAQDRPASAREAFALLERGASEAPTPSGPTHSLAGTYAREKELATIDRLFTELRMGRGATLVITGDPGIGKTSLIQATHRRALECGFRWLEIRLSSGEGLLRSLASTLRLFREDTGQSVEIRRLTDMFASEAKLPTLQESAWILESLIRRLVSSGAVCLIVEDAHEVEPREGDLLRDLARRLADVPVLVAFTCGTGTLEREGDRPRESVSALLSRLPLTERIDLQPLPPAALYRLLEDVAGDARVEEELAQHIAHQSGGNPLLAIEILRHFQETDAVVLERGVLRPGPDWSNQSVPTSFHHLVAERLRNLDADDQAILDVAAVDGVEFDGRAVAAVLDRPLMDVLRRMQGLCRRFGLIGISSAGFRFLHGLVRDAVYASLAPELRRECHRLLALHLEERGAPGGAERIGTHWERAGELPRAVPYVLQAAHEAALRQEIVRAIRLSERAGMIPAKIEVEQAHQHSSVLRSVAWRYADAGRREEQDAIYEVLLRAAEQFHDEELRLKTTVERSFNHFYTDGPSGVDHEVVREAIEKLPPSRSLAWAHYLQGVVAKHGGDLDQAKLHLEKAEEFCAVHQMLGEQSSALDQLGSVAYRQGRVREAEDLYEQAAELSTRAGRRTNAAISQVNRALALNSRGAYDEFEATLEEAIRTLKLEGAKEHAAHALLNLAEARYARSNLERARPAVEEALSLLEGSSYLHVVVWGLGMKALFLAISGELLQAGTELSVARELAEKSQDARSQLRIRSFEIYLDCWTGRLEHAAAQAQHAFDQLARKADPRSRAEFVSRLAESVLYGLSPSILKPAEAVLGDADDSYTSLARQLTAAARFVKTEANDAGDAAVRALTAPVIDHQRAVTEVIGRWLRIEQLRRLNRQAEAQDEMSRALHCATELGHIWLQAALLLYQDQRLGDNTDSQRQMLLGPVASRLVEKDARDDLARSWGIRSS